MATLTSNKNYLQPTGFRVVISRKNYPNIEYFAQAVTHPGVSIPSVELPTFNIRSVPLAGDKLGYDELLMTLILDENMESYKEMYSWLERMSLEGQKNNTDVPPSSAPTYADITLSVLTSHNNQNVQFRYRDCLPTNVSAIQFNAVAAGVEYITFDAGFRFSKFEIV
jgi:hypothetical protein